MLVRAEVSFVNPEEAKKLVDEEGFAVLDVRDRSQYDRAHIQPSYHVPLFVENKDNDPGADSSPKTYILAVAIQCYI